MNSSRGGRGPSTLYRITALLIVALTLVGVLAHQGLAASNPKMITLGESLNDAEKQELLNYFGAKSGDKIVTVTVADTKKDMAGLIDSSFDTAYSSTALTCRPLGDGLDVSIRNITLITPSMYAMALVTAGIGDATLVVAAPNDAPAQGQTALSGVFKAWKKAPCDSGSTSTDRQRLALEELALTADIGTSLSNMTAAGNIVLNTQQAVVIQKLTKSDEITTAVKSEETANGVSLTSDQRAKLVDLMVRLAAQKIDWSTFSAGWKIDHPNDTTITMVGDGIAIRNAQMTATARAANNMTATAQAAMTQTAQASAKKTQEAAAAMTQTAQAVPTKTPVPPTATATATPQPNAVSGTITGSGGGSITIKPASGGGDATYAVDGAAAISRSNVTAALDALKKGDAVSLLVDFNNRVVQISATPAPAGGFNPALLGVAIVPIIIGAGAWLLLKSRGIGEAFVIKRVSAA